MSKPRKNAPALYELIGGRSRLNPPGPEAREEHESEEEVEEEVYEEDPHRTILSPGRTIRMPVGYFFFGLAIIIATGVGCYMLGYKMRDAAYQREERRRAQLETPMEPLDQPVNPNLLGPGAASPGASTRTDTRPAGGVTPPSPELRSGSGRLIIVDGATPDPRQKGVNYARVATLRPDRARELAAFLSERGVDVAVVKTNNARTLSVIALKGFPSGTFRTEERRNYDESLRALCDEYTAQGGGRSVYGDPLWEKYDG